MVIFAMTIYWERCSICGRYHAVKQCTLYNDVLVCPHCCLTCPKRNECPKPVWYAEIKPIVKKAVPRRKEVEKVFMDLLSMLETPKENK